MWAAIISGLVSAYGSYSSSKAQKKGKNQKQESYRTPYMNAYVSKMSPYLLAAAQQLYAQRSAKWGVTPPDFTSVGRSLGNIHPDYSGVGQPDAPTIFQRDPQQAFDSTNPLFQQYWGTPADQQNQVGDSGAGHGGNDGRKRGRRRSMR